MEKQQVINTKNSFLDVYQNNKDIEFKNLIKLCVQDIKDKLLIKPQINLYGKICNQQRDVAFFSDESIGYQYSGQLAKSQSLTYSLKKLLNFINNKFNANFNGILINRYNTGL